MSEASANPAQTSPLNEKNLASLAKARTVRGESLLARMVAAFLESAPASMGDLARGRENGDIQRVCRAAHDLAGSSSYFGADRLHRLCADAERLCRSGQTDELGPLAEQIREEYAAVETALKALPL